MQTRSYKRITLADLGRLGEIAKQDRQDLFRRKRETGHLYSNRLFAVALCQGAAKHYIDHKNGIKDLDVWSFYRAHPRRPFPYRRRGIADLGYQKFGRSADRPQYVGRRVDLIGRSIESRSFSNPIEVLRNYLSAGRTKSARLLSQKAMVLIEPSHLRGTVVWGK